MSLGASGEAPAVQALLARVAALRDSDSASLQADPVRLRYLEALAHRVEDAPAALQRVLALKLATGLEAIEAPTPARAAVPDAEPAGRRTAPPAVQRSSAQTRPQIRPDVAAPVVPTSLLGQLNQHIQLAAQTAAGIGPNGLQPIDRPDLKSAIRFRETWARISAETEVDQATHRAPENAGPLNAHHLVLRTLALMRDLSPDYLRRFMTHTESLLWLDQAYGQLKQPAGKAKAKKMDKAGKRN